MLQRVNSTTTPKLVAAVLDLLDTDRLPQGAGETGVVRRASEHVLLLFLLLAGPAAVVVDSPVAVFDNCACVVSGHRRDTLGRS